MQKQFLALFKRIKENQENPIFSPLGLETLLTLLAEGTKGDTRQALYKILELSPISNALESLLERLKFIEENRSTPLLESTNTIYYSPLLVNPVDEFIEKVKFNLELTLKPQLSGAKELAFIVENKLNIKAFWLQHFNPIPHKTEFFTLANGEEVETLFINQSNIFGKNKTRYLKRDNFHAIQIPFKEKGLCAEIYLPFQQDGLAGFVQNLKSTDIIEWGTAFQEVERMDVYLPKFEVEFKAGFSADLKQLGLDKLFQASWDFTPMFESERGLYIKKIKQDNFFKLNEHGIEAGSTSRAYVGIAGTFHVDKFILFEATHPFLYLIRERETDAILFIGLFEKPNTQKDFSKTYYNLAERTKFLEDKRPFSLRFGFALAAYTLERLTYHFRFKNDFVEQVIDKIWTLVITKEGEVFNERAEVIDMLEWPIPLHQIQGKHSLSNDKNHLSHAPRQIISIFHDLKDRINGLRHNFDIHIDFSDGLKNISLLTLSTLGECLPNWELSNQYRRIDKNLWGAIITREGFFTIFKSTFIQTELTTNQIKERKQNKIIRNLKPKLFDITIRGKLYIGLVCLDKILEKQQIDSIELKEWLLDLVDFVSNETSTKFDELVLLRFDLFNQTGFFDKNIYFSKDALDAFKNKYPYLVNILAGLDGILNSYKYLKRGDNFDFSFNCMLDFLKVLVQYKIELPNQTLFEQFPIKKADVLGKPIKLDKKNLKNCFKIIK